MTKPVDATAFLIDHEERRHARSEGFDLRDELPELRGLTDVASEENDGVRSRFAQDAPLEVRQRFSGDADSEKVGAHLRIVTFTNCAAGAARCRLVALRALSVVG